MQTSLSRRQRHRRTGAARRGRGGGGSARRAALAIPILLFASFLALGGAAFIGTVSAYAYYSRDLPDPAKAFAALGFDQPSIVYDRTGTVELARFGAAKRELVTFSQIPPELIDATTAVEDKDFWSNPGFDLGGFLSASIDTALGKPRGGSTITQQLVRARLLPPAAFTGSTYERKIREIIQSIRLTQAFPDQTGKEQIITAYLNQNFYGNQSYGVAAAARSYFNKSLKDLTLAEAAILAAIPQSPTQYDLVKSAVTTCTVAVAAGATCPTANVQLVVPATSDIVLRRNRVLDLMATRSVLSGTKYTSKDYEAAKAAPVILTRQDTAPWKAAQFVWQVRHQLGVILCGALNADTCERVDTGGYRIVTSLDWKMQQVVEKWLTAAARAPNTSDPHATLTALGIPKADWGWIDALKGRNVHNAASGIIDYRTGEVLAYGGSAGYYAAPEGTLFQPQYDILSDGFRQPGSSIKPFNYITGIDDHTMTASTMFMDVYTNVGGTPPFAPTQLDKLERGPVRLRSALQFSLNTPSVKAGLINGLDHLFQRMKDFGLVFPPGTVPAISMALGTLEVHPIDMISGYGAIADGGMLMPRQLILKVDDGSGGNVYPANAPPPTGVRVATEQASYIITDILQQNTIASINPYWGAWVILEGGKRRPAAYKTGTTTDNKDVHAYGYLAPPVDPKAPALVVGVWLGNSDASMATGSASLDANSALWSRIMTEASKGTTVANFVQPSGIVKAKVDLFSGLLPGPYTQATIDELFINGTVPTRTDNIHIELDIDQATGKLWQDGCTGPKVKKGFLDFSNVDPRFPAWQPYTLDWAARAAKGPGVVGGLDKTRTSYFFNSFFQPFGKTWGGVFPPTEVCAPVTPPVCAPGTSFDPLATVDPQGSPQPTPCIQPTPAPSPSGGGPVPPVPSPSGGGLVPRPPSLPPSSGP